MFVTNWISTTKIQKISEITNFFRHYFLSRTEVAIKKENNRIKIIVLCSHIKYESVRKTLCLTHGFLCIFLIKRTLREIDRFYW